MELPVTTHTHTHTHTTYTHTHTHTPHTHMLHIHTTGSKMQVSQIYTLCTLPNVHNLHHIWS